MDSSATGMSGEPSGVLGAGGYPVHLVMNRAQSINRWWGIPLVGLIVRWVLLIPHWFVLAVLGLITGLSVLVSWIPVLFLGRMPDGLFDLYVMTYRWGVRVAAYAVLMTDAYPPFSMHTPYGVDLLVERRSSINRLWGIPFFGLFVREILLIPQAIVLFFLGIAVYVVMFVVWIPVLVNGRFPQVGYDLFGGYLRLTSRVSLWILLMPLPYPPFGPSE
jgi:hypothetical protein